MKTKRNECDVLRWSRGLHRPLWPTLRYANSIVLWERIAASDTIDSARIIIIMRESPRRRALTVSTCSISDLQTIHDYRNKICTTTCKRRRCISSYGVVRVAGEYSLKQSCWVTERHRLIDSQKCEKWRKPFSWSVARGYSDTHSSCRQLHSSSGMQIELWDFLWSFIV